MDSKQLIEHAKRIASEVGGSGNDDIRWESSIATVCEFLRQFAGEKSSFLTAAKKADQYIPGARQGVLASAVEAFARYVECGLVEEISPERRAQLDVVSDLLEQANTLLETANVHPAAPAVLIGATLEEFLRTWVETAKLPLGARKPSIESYSQVLREPEFITKQDAKDITAWGGIRNHAAHGEWAEVASKEKVSLMLQGVNLFIRKYERGKAD